MKYYTFKNYLISFLLGIMIITATVAVMYLINEDIIEESVAYHNKGNNNLYQDQCISLNKRLTNIEYELKRINNNIVYLMINGHK